MAGILTDIIIVEDTRPACAGPRLIRYCAGGVFVALSDRGRAVRFVDFVSDRELSAVSFENPADVCCYAVFFGNKVNAFRHMEKIRHAKKAPRLIIAFGNFASVFSEEILARGLADVVVTGDPESVIPALLAEVENKSLWKTIPNLSYLHQGEVVHTAKDFSYDLDAIPFISPFLCSRGHRPAFMMTARGCRRHCVFCDRNALWGGKIRQRSVDNVLREIKEVVETYHVEQIDFLDEDLAADHKRLAGICKGIRDIKEKFIWSCAVCVDSVNKELLWLMGRSGCREIFFGMESASPEVLRRIGKTYGRQEILNAVRWAQEAGLKVEVMVTAGNPGETDRDREMTSSLLEEIGKNVNIINNRLIVLPGSPLFRKGLTEGWFTRESFFEDEGIILYEEKEHV